MRPCQRIFIAALALCAVTAALAAGVDSALDRYLAGLQSLQADFSQEARDVHGKLVERGKGHLVIQRPGRFRWEFKADGVDGDGGQLMVADGRNLWFYERELAQVTVRDAASALGATPVVLLSGTSSDIESAFTVRSAGSGGGLERVEIIPHAIAADFSRAEIGFRGAVLASMDISNKLGQTVHMNFTHVERNRALAPGLLDFVVPPGVDVIGTALK